MISQEAPHPHDPLAMKLSGADDRVLLSEWFPRQEEVVPRIRIGQRWINVLWALPLVFVLLVIGVTVAQALRELPAAQDFLAHYPGIPVSAVAVTTGLLFVLAHVTLVFITGMRVNLHDVGGSQ